MRMVHNHHLVSIHIEPGNPKSIGCPDNGIEKMLHFVKEICATIIATRVTDVQVSFNLPGAEQSRVVCYCMRGRLAPRKTTIPYSRTFEDSYVAANAIEARYLPGRSVLARPYSTRKFESREIICVNSNGFDAC